MPLRRMHLGVLISGLASISAAENQMGITEIPGITWINDSVFITAVAKLLPLQNRSR